MIKGFSALLIFVFIVYLVGQDNEPEATKAPQKREWTVQDSKAYARDAVSGWADNQYACLNKLWTKESNWRSEAYNKIKVMGKNAGGIPQLLGLNPKVPAPIQIDRGLKYIIHRHGTPCMAWKFHQRKGWY